jgi:hypothetical protein
MVVFLIGVFLFLFSLVGGQGGQVVAQRGGGVLQDRVPVEAARKTKHMA